MKRPLTLLFACFLCAFFSNAQPANLFLGGSGDDQIAQMIPAPDGNFLATGARQTTSGIEAWLLKLSAKGDVLWEKTFPALTAGWNAFGYGLRILPNGNLLITGAQKNPDSYDDGIALAILADGNGNSIWRRTYASTGPLYDAAPSGANLLLVGSGDPAGSYEPGALLLVNANGILQWRLPVEVYNQTKVRRIFPTADGKFLLIGRTNVIGAGFGGLFLRKVEPDGTQIWQRTTNTNWDELHTSNTNVKYNLPLGAVQQPDGSVWVTNPVNASANIGLFHFGANGVLLQQKNYGDAALYELPYSLSALPGGGWLITGEAYLNISAVNFQGFAMAVDSGGLERWRQYYGADQTTDRLFAGSHLPDGQLLLAGMSNGPATHGGFDGWLLHAEADGNVLPWTIEGRVVFDLNNNCQADPGELPAAGWFVSVTDSATQWLVTDTDGRFVLRTGTGAKTLALNAAEPANAWKFCTTTQTVTTDNANPQANVVFLVQSADGGCPHTEVSLTQPDLVRCERSRFFVTVRNRGTGESGDLLLQLTLDPDLELLAASESYSQSGQLLEFAVPPMDGQQEHILWIDTRLRCAVQMSATHTVVARLIPVECAPAWNGPRFAVEGACAGSAVQFRLSNQGGGGPAAITRYRVMADDLLANDWTEIALPQDAPAQTLAFPADGRTWRVELEQAPGFPGDSYPAAAVEGCGQGHNGLHSIALRNAWHFDEDAPEVAAFLAPNTTGVPNKVAEATRGFGYYNLIDNLRPLEFTARARNPRAAPANTAEFRLSFNANWDISTFQALACNAPAKIELDKAGLIRVRMQDIQLDSGAYAFLRFRIRPLPGIPADSAQASLLLVNANAYFDSQGPYALAPAFLNYSQLFPNATDPYNDYLPQILRYGGRGVDFGTAVAPGTDGTVFLVGESNSFCDRANYDGFLVKTDANGRAIWLRAFDLGDQGSNTFRGAAALPDGGCLVVGNYRQPDAITNYLSDYTAYLARISADGTLLWHKKFRPAGAQAGSWTSGIVRQADGGFVIFGHTSLDGSNNTDQFYIKTDADGNVLWQKYTLITGSAFIPEKALATADGGAIFMGSNQSTVLDYDVFVEKIDATGNTIWSKGYNSKYGINLGGIAPAADEGFMVNGYSQWEFDSTDYVTTPTFIRYSAAGDVLWEKDPVIGTSHIARAYNLTPAPGGGYFTVGETVSETPGQGGNVLLLKTDEDAEPLWWHDYGSRNYESAEAVLVSASNHLLIFGYNQDTPPLYDLQSLLVRTDLDGNLTVGLPPEAPEPLAGARVFPNPVGHMMHVSRVLDTQTALYWELRDVSGRVAKSGVASEALFDLDVSRLPTGCYALAFPGRGWAPQRVVVVR